MEVIRIESDAFKKLSEKIDNIERFVREAGKRTEDLDKMWVDGYTICQYLHVSERTLRRLRAHNLFHCRPQILLYDRQCQTFYGAQDYPKQRRTVAKDDRPLRSKSGQGYKK